MGLLVRGQEVGFLLGLAQSSHPQQMVNPYIGHAHCMNLRHLTFWSDRFLNPTVSYVKTLVIKLRKMLRKTFFRPKNAYAPRYKHVAKSLDEISVS